MVTIKKPSTHFQTPPKLWFALVEMRLHGKFQTSDIRQKPTKILTSPPSLSSHLPSQNSPHLTPRTGCLGCYFTPGVYCSVLLLELYCSFAVDRGLFWLHKWCLLVGTYLRIGIWLCPYIKQSPGHGRCSLTLLDE